MPRLPSVAGPSSATYVIDSVGSLGGTRVSYPITVVVQAAVTPTGPRLRVLSWTEGS